MVYYSQQKGTGASSSGNGSGSNKQMTVVDGKGSSGVNPGTRKTGPSETRRRVKLYALNAEKQWDDKGTGHVSSSYVERLKGTSLLVRAEADGKLWMDCYKGIVFREYYLLSLCIPLGSLLLESKIQPDTAYQKQQETLIVWSEGGNYDLALSFQERAGCDEIWEKICQVQGKDPSVDITQDIVEESEDEKYDEISDFNTSTVDLPSPEIGRLEEINEVVTSCMTSPLRREKLALLIENENYIRKLLNVFHICEDVEDLDGLRHLYSIFKNIFLLNKNALFEVMFSEELIFDVIGCLEYDPTQSQPKPHREYLKRLSQFHEVIPIRNPELLSKIHQTYRVQYIQDVVLPTPSLFEENMSTLSSFIFFNKVEIVSLIQEDENFLMELFSQLTDESTSDAKRRDLVLFLKELCTFSQTLQPQSRETFLKLLSSLGILPALELALGVEDHAVRSAAIDILAIVVEFSPSLVREYMLLQSAKVDEEQLLSNVIIEQIICDPDPELAGAVQLIGVLKILLDPENMLASINKSERTDFLTYFYKHSMHELIAPLLANTSSEDGPSREDSQTVQLLSLILEVLGFCVDHHAYHIKNYILGKDLLRRILVLLRSRHTFLSLCSLRLMRKIVGLKDEFYNRYIIRGNLFAPVVDSLIRNNGRYNLLDSALLELFEFIKMEDIKSLCTHVIEVHGKKLDKIEYVQTFKSLQLRYDQQMDRLHRDKFSIDGSLPPLMQRRTMSRFRRDPRDLDEDEELWFEAEDDVGEPSEGTSASLEETDAPSGVLSVGMLERRLGGGGGERERESEREREREREKDEEMSPDSTTPTPSPSPVAMATTLTSSPVHLKASLLSSGKIGLVDYEGDSDEEDNGMDEDETRTTNSKRDRKSEDEEDEDEDEGDTSSKRPRTDPD